jgi:hypothetical protein
MTSTTSTNSPATLADAQPVPAATQRLYCGHTAEGTPGKIPHAREIGLYCHDCRGWVASMPEAQPVTADMPKAFTHPRVNCPR